MNTIKFRGPIELEEDITIRTKNGSQINIRDLVAAVNDLTVKVAQLEKVVMEDYLLGKVDPKTET